MGKKTAFLKNAGRTLGTATVDAAGDLMPNLKRSVNQNKAYIKNAYTKYKSNQKESDWHDTYLYRATKRMVDNAIEDLKSGNFNNKERAEKLSSDAFNKAFNFDFDNIDFDSENFDDELNFNNNDNGFVDATLNNANVNIDTSMDEESKFNIKQIANLNATVMKINTIGFNTINTQMRSMINFHNKNTLTFYENVDEKLAKMTDNLDMLGAYLTDISNNNEKMRKSSGSYSGKKSLRDAFNTKGIAIEDWINMYKKNSSDKSSTEGYKFLFNTMVKPEIEKLVGNPIGFLTKNIIKGLIPKNIKNSMKDTDNLIGLLPLLMQGKFKEWSKQSGIKSILGNFLSLDKFRVKSNKYEYQKGPISWNGQAQRALTHVIPGYLSKILVGINKLAGIKQKELFYDYDAGKFTDKGSATEFFKNKYKEASKVSGGGTDALKKDIMNELKKQGKIKTDADALRYDEKIEDILSSMGRKGTLFNNVDNLGDITGYTYKTVKNPETGKSEQIKVPKDPKLAKIILDKYKNANARTKMNINEELGDAFRNFQEKVEELNDNDLYQQMYNFKTMKYKKDKKISVEDIFKKVDEIVNDDNIDDRIPGKAKGVFNKAKSFYNKKRNTKDDRNEYASDFLNTVYKYFLDPEQEVSMGDIRDSFGKNMYNAYSDLKDTVDSFIKNKKKEYDIKNPAKDIFKNVKIKGIRKAGVRDSEQDIEAMTDVTILSSISNMAGSASSGAKSIFRQILKNKKSNNPTNLGSRMMSLFNASPDDGDNNQAELVKDFTSEDTQGKNTIEWVKTGMQHISDKKIKLGTDENPMVVRVKGGWLDKLKDVDDADIPGMNTAAGQRAATAEKKKQNELLKALASARGGSETVAGGSLGLGDLMHALESTDETLTEGILKEAGGEIVEHGVFNLAKKIGSWILPSGATAAAGKAAKKTGLFSKLGNLFSKAGKGAKTAGSNIWGKIGNIFGKGSKAAGSADDIANTGTKLLGSSDDVTRAFSGLNTGTKVIEGVDYTVDGVNVASKASKSGKWWSKIASFFGRNGDDIARGAANSSDDVARAAGTLSTGGKIASGLGKAGKLLGKLALPLTLLTSGIDAFKGWNKAGEYYGKDQENTDFIEKLNAAIANVASGFTFGIIKPEKMIKTAQAIGDKNPALGGLMSYRKDRNGKTDDDTLKEAMLKDLNADMERDFGVSYDDRKTKLEKKQEQDEAKLKESNNTKEETVEAAPTQANMYMTQGDSNGEFMTAYATDSELQTTDVGKVYLRMKYDESLENAELLSSVLEPNTAKGHIVSTAYFYSEFARSEAFEHIYGVKGLFNLIYEEMKARGGIRTSIAKLLGFEGGGSDEASASTSGDIAGSQYWDEVFNFVGEEESNNDPGEISNISWDAGGKSYGSYQFSLNEGSLEEFVNWLGTVDNAKAQEYHKRLTQYQLGSSAFDSEWKKIAEEDREGFQDLQQQRMIEAFYKPAVAQIQKIQPQFDPTKYTVALNSLIMSTATQFGPGGYNKNGNVWKAVFGNANNLDDETKMIELFKTSRKSYFPATSSRYDREYNKAMALYEKYKGTSFGDGTGSTGNNSNASTSAAVNKAISVAQQLVNEGWPYVWGGESKEEGGFDCSGLCQYAYKQAGINIPRTTYEQIAQLPAVEVAGSDGLANAKPGDLLFPHDGHVYMYEGNGYILEAPQTGLNLRRVKNTRQIQYIRRVVTDQGANDCTPGSVSCYSRYNKITGQASRDTSSYGVTMEQFSRMRNSDKNNLMVQLRDIMNNVGENTSKTNEILSKILDKLSEYQKTVSNTSSMSEPFSLSNELLYTYKGY